MSSSAVTLLDSLQPYAISFLIGIGAGIERERSQTEETSIMGMRTFALIALLGTLAAELAVPALTLGLALFITALVVLGYWRSTQNSSHADFGLTTEFAAGLVFGLGYLASIDPFLSVILGIVLIATLYFRKRLHWFARDVLRPEEITAAILLAVFVFVLIPFLPNHAVDPWNLLNPRQLAQVVALIAAIEFCGYASERIAGPKVGLLVTGFLGGFASSTAVFLSLSQVARQDPQKMKSLIGACLLSIVSPLLLFLMIIAATSADLLPGVSPPIIAAGAQAALLGLVIGSRTPMGPANQNVQRNPLDLRSLARLGLIIAGLLTLAALMQNYVGAKGISLVSFVGGLFELHGVTLATATLHAAHSISDRNAVHALLLAVLASFLSKLVIAWTLAPGRFAWVISGLLVFILGLSGLVFAFLK